jgi:hypothetical protein
MADRPFAAGALEFAVITAIVDAVLPALRPEQVETNVAPLSANDACSTARYGSRPKEKPIASKTATNRLIAGMVFRPNVASQTFASWNLIGDFLRQLAALRRAA